MPVETAPQAPYPPAKDASDPAEVFDLIVVGSGAGGLSAAVVAAHLGLTVCVLEKDAQYGGTTAWSGGWMWVPRNPLAAAAGIFESIEAPLMYLQQALGKRFNAASEPMLRQYLKHAPQVVRFFQSHTALQFVDGNGVPDFLGKLHYAARGGRSVCAAPFDAWQLARFEDSHCALSALKPPLPETTLWGMGIAAGADLRHFLNWSRSWASFQHVLRRVASHVRDRFLFGRSMQLVNGHAMVAALAVSAFERGVQLRLKSPVLRVLQGDGAALGAGKFHGVVVASADGEKTLRARAGVVLACGGFPHDAVRKAALLPHAQGQGAHYSAASRGNTGDALRMGEALGGHVPRDFQEAAALAPVSLVPQRGGSFTHFPHLLERAKPGLIAVTAQGRRFGNEANSYYDLIRDLLAATPHGQPVQAWLVCDHAFIRRYGLGAVKPAPLPLRAHLRSGYLQRANSPEQLATACGIDAAGLAEAIRYYNWQARTGTDVQFGRGDTAYNRIQGDNTQSPVQVHQPTLVHGKTKTYGVPEFPNSCMAPMVQGPFYAVRVVAGSLGTFAGLACNEFAQVTQPGGSPIAGLYAAGNDMASIFCGHYPSGGITLGPALTFGYLAAQHAAASLKSFTPPHPLTDA